MINFNVGALRPATDDARLKRVQAANDLVQRTLSQHGLMPDMGMSGAGAPQSSVPGLDHLVMRQTSPLGKKQFQDVALPGGAEFLHDHYTCAAGSRSYRTYIPASSKDGPSGIIVMLHGCTQNLEDFAVGTGMNALAEMHGFVVIYPEQSRGSNAQSCWNWFSRGDQCRDRGEPAILAGMTRKAMAEHDITRQQTFVAGLSAGAAMAVILGETYPDVFSAVGAHSGLAYGTAKDVPSAFAAMAGNALDAPIGAPKTPAIRTIVFHGTADATVHPSNGERIAKRVMDHGPRQTVQTDRQGRAAGRTYTCKITSTTDGPTELEHWVVDGLGHAWSGGQPNGSYTDPDGPDASAEMIRFFFETATQEN
jgi:poly(hydroxyalkanoate) depolymerase family esterase